MKLVAMVAAMVVTLFTVPGVVHAAEKRAIPAARQVTGMVNLNTASAKELELLPGVGKKTAALIVAYREKQPFKAPTEIVKVKGVGKGIFKRIKDHVTVNGPTTLAVVSAREGGGGGKTGASAK